jgi:GNAT superfamily N-acetyltransferase
MDPHQQLTFSDLTPQLPPPLIESSKVRDVESHLGTNSSSFDSSDGLACSPLLHQISIYPAHRAATMPQVVKRVSSIFNESFGFRPDGRPYRLGPKSTAERLAQTDYLFIAGGEDAGVGYLFGKEISSSFGRIAWIESMAVLPLYRRQGVATALVNLFAEKTVAARRVGCATPNPIAGLVITRVIPGKLFIGRCNPPYYLLQMFKQIRQYCFDLRGCSIDEENLLIATGFSPLSRSDPREWLPRTSKTKPCWWSTIEHLPNKYEALLVIER